MSRVVSRRPPRSFPIESLDSICVASWMGGVVWGRMDTCVRMAESLHCSSEAHHAANRLYPRTKLEVFKRGLGFRVEKEMATHSSILAWRIPWTEEPGGLLSIGSHRVGHD